MLTTNIFLYIFINALVSRKDLAIFYSRIAILALLATSYITYQNVFALALEKGIALYGGLYTVSTLTQTFTIFILLISGVILIYNSFYHTILTSKGLTSIKQLLNRKAQFTLINQGDSNLQIYKILEYPLIIMFIITGAIFLMGSADLISLFIAIELQSYGLYILSTLHRDSEQATWGGLTYFLLGGLSSCFILLGSGLLYINSGTTSLEALYIITTLSDIIPNSIALGVEAQGLSDTILSPLSYTQDTYYINLSLIIMTVGFLFKVSAAPFHFWSPDVYDAIPTTVTTYVALIAKISIFIFLLELVYYINNDSSALSWKNCLLVSSLFSLIIGSLLGLTQYRIKRVYAYSTISHVGFILLALTINTAESIQAYLFYILSYTISNLNAFIILVTIGYTMYFYINSKEKERSLAKGLSMLTNNSNKGAEPFKSSRSLSLDLGNVKEKSFVTSSEIDNSNISINSLENLKDKNNSPIQLVSQLKGYFYINPYLALSLAITLFSFIGIPPLVGFFAKQMVLSAALDSGYIFITLVGILTSVIGAGYYLNIVKHMFFFKSDYIINPLLSHIKYFGLVRQLTSNSKENKDTVFMRNDIKVSSALSIIISILTLLLLLFIFIPNESFNLAKILSLLLFN